MVSGIPNSNSFRAGILQQERSTNFTRQQGDLGLGFVSFVDPITWQ
jgi:hypothetical protein